MKNLMEGRFMGRDLVQEPRCPFCRGNLERPAEIPEASSKDMALGTCQCGAVYAYDATGHNLGSAMSEALVYGCRGDWDLAWDLLPDEDYLQARLEHYDMDSHLIVPGGVYEGRRIAGVLYFIFIRGQKNYTSPEAVQTSAGAPVHTRKSAPQRRGKRSYSKKDIEALVRDYNVEALLDIARTDARIIRDLQRLLYSVETLIRHRAAEILGKAAALIAEREANIISNLLQGLFTSLTDTAASGWGSLAAIGEIISSSPDRFGSYMPQLFMLSRDRTFLKDILDALRKISASNPDLLRKYTYHFIPLLADQSAEVRGLTSILLGNLAAGEAGEDLAALCGDDSEMEIYRDGRLEKVKVGLLALEALKRI